VTAGTNPPRSPRIGTGLETYGVGRVVGAIPAERRLSQSRALPATPPGSCRNNESDVNTYVPFPTGATSIAPRFSFSPGSCISMGAWYRGSIVLGMYSARSCTQPSQSLFSIRFGKVRTFADGSRTVTGTSSTVTRSAGCDHASGYGNAAGTCAIVC